MTDLELSGRVLPALPGGDADGGRPVSGDTVIRPDGRAYKSRKATANAVVDDDEILTAVVVLGTHDVARAQPLADDYAAWQLGRGHVAVDPVTGWWRDGWSYGRRVWLDDPVHGRAGVWFREIVEVS